MIIKVPPSIKNDSFDKVLESVQTLKDKCDQQSVESKGYDEFLAYSLISYDLNKILFEIKAEKRKVLK